MSPSFVIYGLLGMRINFGDTERIPFLLTFHSKETGHEWQRPNFIGGENRRVWKALKLNFSHVARKVLRVSTSGYINACFERFHLVGPFTIFLGVSRGTSRHSENRHNSTILEWFFHCKDLPNLTPSPTVSVKLSTRASRAPAEDPLTPLVPIR